MNKYNITKHASNRYTERILNNIPSINLYKEMLSVLNTGKDITNNVYDIAPRYILYLYEKYNELGLTIIESNNIIFICRKQKGTNNLYNVVTCYKSENHLNNFINTSLSRQDIFIKIKQIKSKLK